MRKDWEGTGRQRRGRETASAGRISAALPFEEEFVVFELISRVADRSNEGVAR
jgi:hypothetical protein